MTAIADLTQKRRLLDIPEVARALHLSDSSIRRRIAGGELPVVRLGGGPKAPVRIEPADLADYIERGRKR